MIASIVKTVPPGIATFLLTSQRDVSPIVRQQRRTGVNTIQIVDSFPIDHYNVLRRALPEIKIVQVVHVVGEQSLIEAQAMAPHVDALLLDSGNPSLRVKELGGTGRVHDWTISRRICDAVKIPVYLAGGLKPENVAQAINEVRPFAVDVCSGVRTKGRLDEGKLQRFVRAALTSSNLV